MKPISIHLDRLDAALRAQGVDMKRTKLLEVAAGAFGYHNTHECTAASKRGDLVPPMAEAIGRLDMPGGNAIIVLRDPLANALYGIDESFVERCVEEERRETYGPSPFGHLLDLSGIADSTESTTDLGRIAGPSGMPAKVHMAEIHHSHGIDIRIGTTLAIVSRQVGEYVRENWQEAWDADQNLEPGERNGLPEEPGGLSDDEAEEMFFAAMSATDPTNYVEYDVVDVIGTRHVERPVAVEIQKTTGALSGWTAEEIRNGLLREGADAGRKTPSGYLVHCPAHEDRSHSLAISDGPDGVALRCIAGCEDDVVRSIVEMLLDEKAEALLPVMTEGLYDVFATQDGDNYRETVQVGPGESIDRKARQLIATHLRMALEDHVDPEMDPDEEEAYVDFDCELDSIEISPCVPSSGTLRLMLGARAAIAEVGSDSVLGRILVQAIADAMPKATV